MDEVVRREIEKVAEVAKQALKTAEQAQAGHDGHVDLCAERWTASKKALDDLRDDMRESDKKFDHLAADLTDRVKMVGETLRQQTEALTDRVNTMDSDMNTRQSNTAATIIGSVNQNVTQTLTGFKELMEKGLDIADSGVKAAHAALAAFQVAQAETNRMLGGQIKGASDDAKTATNRVWQLGSGLLGVFILISAYLYIHKGP